MDKKKQFQKQLLISKIKENTVIVSTLEKLYNDLINNSISNSNITIMNTTINNTINNTSIDKLNTLQNYKFNLENTKQSVKQNINNLTLTISQLEHNLKVLPLNTKDTLEKEISIYNDEHQRIESERLETINSNLETINNACLDKEQLLKDIELLKVNINLQSNVITNTQKESHSSRKNILESLKEKKQLKIKLNNTIENATINENLCTQQITDLNNSIENLIKFKKLLVNDEYNTDTDTDIIIKTTELEDYYKLYNIDNTMLLNDKLNTIDNIISSSKIKILLLNKKLSKNEYMNNCTIKDTANNYNKTNSSKVLTYKDQFKIEKEKKTILEMSLDEKINKYNNYQTVVIDQINNDFKSKIECLNLDKLNADKRLMIIKVRMNREFENKKKELKNTIEKTKQELSKQHEIIHDISNNIKNTMTSIENTTVLNDELYILENKIKKHKEIISITEKDLEIINIQ